MDDFEAFQAAVRARSAPTPTYDTPLAPDEESKFQEWKKQYAPKDSGEDYDLRGAYKEGLKPDPETGHWPDTYKKPNHPTFSVESKYAKDRPDLAGSWQGDKYIPADDGLAAFQAAVKGRATPQTVVPPLPGEGITREQRLEMLKQGEPGMLNTLKEAGAQAAQTFVGDLKGGINQMMDVQPGTQGKMLFPGLHDKPQVDVGLPQMAEGALRAMNSGFTGAGKFIGTMELDRTGSPLQAAIADAATQVLAPTAIAKVMGPAEAAAPKPGEAPKPPMQGQPEAPPQPQAAPPPPPPQPPPPSPEAIKAATERQAAEATASKPRLRWNPEKQSWDPAESVELSALDEPQQIAATISGKKPLVLFGGRGGPEDAAMVQQARDGGLIVRSGPYPDTYIAHRPGHEGAAEELHRYVSSEGPYKGSADYNERVGKLLGYSDAEIKRFNTTLTPAEPKGTTLESAVIPGLKQFVEQDVAPAAKSASTWAKESKDWVKSVFSPKSVSPEARASGESLTKWTSRAQEAMRLREKVRAEMVGEAAKWSPAEHAEFWQNADVRKPQASPEKENIAQALYSILDDQTRQIKEIPGAMTNFMEDYFPRLYKQSEQASEYFGGRSLEGPRGFTKARKHADLMSSLAAAHEIGLEPISQNPVEMAFMAMDNQDRYIAGQKFFADLKDKGYVKFLKPGERAPAGMTEIDDKIARRFYRYQGREDLDVPAMYVPSGRYVAPDSVARIINNYTGPGLGQNQLYRAFRGTSGTLNMLELGASAFHASTEAVTAGGTDLARAIKLAGNGHPIEALPPLLRAGTGTSIIRQVKRGGEVLKYANDENFRITHPELAKVYQSYVDSGGNFKGSSQFRNRFWESSKQAFKNGNIIGGALRAPLAAIERSTAPLFDYLIPRVKVGAFRDMLQDWMRDHPGASEAEALKATNGIQDSIDNRFGMVNYDRWNLDRKLRDTWFTMLRAPGWTLGNIREFGGGAADLARGRFTDKAAFTLSLPIAAGWYTALYQHAKTGEWPDLAGPISRGDMAGALRNLLTAKTGRMNADGTPETVVIPGLHKDMLSFGFNAVNPLAQGDIVGGLQGLGRFVQGKLNPWWNIVTNVYANQDWYHREIMDRSKGMLGQAGDLAKFMATQTEPFSGQTMQRRMEQVGGKPVALSELPGAMAQHPVEALESAAGIQPASKVVSQTEMERFLRSKLGSGAPMTEKQYEKRLGKNAAEAALRSGDTAAARGAMPPGQFTKSDMTRVAHEAQETARQKLYSQSSLENLAKAVPLASPDEKAELLKAMGRKLETAHQRRSIPADDVREYLSVYRKLQDDVKKNAEKGKGLSWSEMAQKFAMAKKGNDDTAWREIRAAVNKKINAKLGHPTLGMNPQDYQRYLPMIVEALKPIPESDSGESLRS